MSKYLLDKAITVALTSTIIALEVRNIQHDALNCPQGAVYLWADVGDFSRFRHRQTISIENQMQLQINQSIEDVALVHAQY